MGAIRKVQALASSGKADPLEGWLLGLPIQRTAIASTVCSTASTSTSCCYPGFGVVVAWVGTVIAPGPIRGSPLMGFDVSSIVSIVPMDLHLGDCITVNGQAICEKRR
jgi:hypothetical protein